MPRIVAMEITFAHYRNRFCMFRTYYALATKRVQPDGIDMTVIQLPDPPSKEQEEALIRGDVHVANLYLPNFLRRKLQGAPIHPTIKNRLLEAFRASFAYSEAHLDEIADAFIDSYGGDKEALLASARYPHIDFTFTATEQRLAEAEMELLVEVGQIPRMAPISTLFAA